jgi:hypothetical protein
MARKHSAAAGEMTSGMLLKSSRANPIRCDLLEPFILLLSPKLTIAEHQPEKVALELFIFPTPTSPARVPQATVVDFVCALFPFFFELG